MQHTQMQTVTYRECKLATAFYVGKCIRSVQHKIYFLMVSVETMCSIKGSIVAIGIGIKPRDHSETVWFLSNFSCRKTQLIRGSF